jgi:hypothetical protein
MFVNDWTDKMTEEMYMHSKTELTAGSFFTRCSTTLEILLGNDDGEQI